MERGATHEHARQNAITVLAIADNLRRGEYCMFGFSLLFYCRRIEGRTWDVDVLWRIGGPVCQCIYYRPYTKPSRYYF